MPKEEGWGTSKSGLTLRIKGVAPKEGEKGVALKVDEKELPLHALENVLHF